MSAAKTVAQVSKPAVNCEGKSAHVIYFQAGHGCPKCGRRPVDVFVADIYCPIERSIQKAA
jgi:hypothetical protein